MPINTREIINIVADLSREENLRICVSECFKGACITGGSTFLGGMLLGPVGMALGLYFSFFIIFIALKNVNAFIFTGGLAGVAMNAARGAQFRPLADVLLNDITPVQQAILVNRVNNIIRDFDVQDAITLGTVVLANGNVRAQVLRLLTEFVRSDLNLQLM